MADGGAAAPIRPSGATLPTAGWEFWIDRGGTFTDCIGRAPDGTLHLAKLLSSDRAPVDGIRLLCERAGVIAAGAPLPACGVKLGTTVATNALLERRGVRTWLVTDSGLGDVLTIGTQARPELFDLQVTLPPPLHAGVIEVDGRVQLDGSQRGELDEEALRASLAAARTAGAESVAVVRIHATRDPAGERRVLAIAREAGFAHVCASHQVAHEVGLLARGETSAADAYLTPLLQRHVAALESALGGAALRCMQSSGGLTEPARFRGPTALLSGPAGGVIGAARVAREAGHADAVAFDMGGTSTDVSLIRNGEVERHFETQVGGVRVLAPMLRIHTVAAGGGSLCRFDGFRLTVGPESAGAEPGPLCYGDSAARGDAPGAGLALTDVNLFLGRLQPERFPLPLSRAPVERALADLAQELAAAGHAFSPEQVAAGFVEIANAAMAQAIQEVSVARGVDPREYALVGFGGAAGQHACAVARALGMRDVLLDPLAGVLSARGIGAAELSFDAQRDAGRLPLPPDGALPARLEAEFAALGEEGLAALAGEGAEPASLRVEPWLDLRYVGSETPLSIGAPEDGDWRAGFEAAHRERFGYARPDHAVEIVTLRVRVRGWPAASADAARPSPPAARGDAPSERGRVRAWFQATGWCEAPLYDREALLPGHQLAGPALVLEDTGTVVIDPGFAARVGAGGLLVLRDENPSREPASADLSRADPIRLEVFGNRFMSIAEQMGAVLRNTAHSANIKERLDYSCAVFDAEGGLVANAPHIPVHLGAMGETVRAVRARFPRLAAGDVVVTNDPSEGGSHLPDITAVTPVFCGGEAPAFFVANRGHHADVGGLTPGSMPSDSTCLEEEGVCLAPFLLVSGGRFDEAGLRQRLAGSRHPARSPDENVADLVAQVAANRSGEGLLQALVAERGLEIVAVTMQQLQQAAAAKVGREIGRLADGEHRFEDALDDGSPIAVVLRVAGERMTLDFAGTAPASAGNLNAPRAVVHAAVIYVLRALVAERIPLNGGCLAPVTIRIPPGCLLDPPPGAAVVGGNVETSQRVVDVLLGALGRVAASQGTMNNVTFGDERFGYYETIGGGTGAGDGFPGASGVHSHMTNTRITDAEVLEARYPVVLERFALRRGSGGAGRFRGGDGLVRALRFTRPVTLSLLSERRTRPPYGAAGGAPGAAGRNAVRRADGTIELLSGKAQAQLAAGDVLQIETPGGGGFGPSSEGS